jgi:hypothetical protein
MLPLAGNEKFRGRGRGRVRVRSKNENDSGGPREREPRPRRGSFLVARNRSSIVLVLVLVSAIGCKGEDVGVPKSNKLALMGLKPRAEPSRPLRDEEAFQMPVNLVPSNPELSFPGPSGQRQDFIYIQAFGKCPTLVVPGLKNPGLSTYSPFEARLAQFRDI